MNLLNIHKEAIINLCRQHGVKELYAFGSVLDDDRFQEQSDVDLLVEFEGIPLTNYADNIFDFEESLQQLLGRNIDLISQKYLRNRIFIKQINETKQKLFSA